LVKIKGTYFHYKNHSHFYTVLDLGIDEATEEVSVIYQTHYGKKIIFIRPLKSFLLPGKFTLT
jgi:hypothetical protein